MGIQEPDWNIGNPYINIDSTTGAIFEANAQVTDSILFPFCLFLENVPIKRFWAQELFFVLFVVM